MAVPFFLLAAGCSMHAGGRLDDIRLYVAARQQASLRNDANNPRSAVAWNQSGAATPSRCNARPATANPDAGLSMSELSTDQQAAFRLAGCRHIGDHQSTASDEPMPRQAPARRPGPLPRFLETVRRDLKVMPEDLWNDAKSVYTSPRNLAILGLTYGGSLALQGGGVDNSIEHSMVGHDIFGDGANEAFSVLGNPSVHLGLAGLWYLIGQQSDHDKTYQVGKTLFRALIINDLSVMLGKCATWDKAPNGQYFTFPSGHTSSTFALASVLHRAYGPWIGIPMYGIGVLVAVERIDDDEHYFSDVVMGSVMGLVIGHTVAGGRDLELWGGHIIPYTDPAAGSVGIAWHRRL